MKINLVAIMVDDQQKALDFYTEKLGFVLSQDIPMGEFRWLAVKSPDGGDTELALEPNVNPAGKTFQEAMFEQGIPFTAFEVDDIDGQYRRLVSLGVKFTKEPTPAGNVVFAIFADTCGNLIQI